MTEYSEIILLSYWSRFPIFFAISNGLLFNCFAKDKAIFVEKSPKSGFDDFSTTTLDSISNSAKALESIPAI